RHRAPGLRPSLVRHHHRLCGGDRAHQPARGHEHVRAENAPAPRANGHGVPRRHALHVGGRDPPGHPGRVPHHLAVPAELHALGRSAVVTPARFAGGMTFAQYLDYIGTPENLAREAGWWLGRERRDLSQRIRSWYESLRLSDAQVEAVRWLAA